MTVSRLFPCMLLGLFLLPGMSGTINAGLFDDPRNLKALPEDTSPEELRSTMRGFAISTDSRCSTCHVYENEEDLNSYDFAADDKEKKLKAREMIRMVAGINARIAEIQQLPASELVPVTCATCHRNQDKPRMIEDVVENSYRDGGVEQAVEKYRELRGQYYGGFVFDFSPRPLEKLSEELAANGELEAAFALLDLNQEFNPDHARGYITRAQLQFRAGDKESARQNILKALEIEPDNQWHQMMLKQLDESQ